MPSKFILRYHHSDLMGSYKSRPMNQIVSDQWNQKVSETYEHLEGSINEDLETRPDIGWSPLHIACCDDDVGRVLDLLETHTLYQVTQTEHLTPLHLACINCRYEIVRALLEHCADVKSTSLHGFSPIHIAAYKGDCILLSQLLSRDFHEINICCEYGDLSPLHIAAIKGHTNAVDYLLDHGADPEMRDLIHYSPLHIACYFGHVEVADVLLSHGADINAEGQISDNPLHLSCSRGHSELALLLINKYNPNINATDNERHLSLHIAARLGMVSVIEALLLKNEQDLNPHTWNIYRDTPLHIACYSGQLEATNKLIELGGTESLQMENIFSETPFHSACTNGTNVALLKMLMTFSKVDINMQGRDGHTGLHSACYHGHVEVVQFLLESGANAHLMARGQESDQVYDESCLMWAYEKGFDEVITLLKRKARPPVEENGSGAEYSPSSSDSSDLYQIAVPSPIGKIRSMTKEKADIMQLRETLDTKYQIKLNEIEQQEPVGSGSFGKVYKGRWIGKLVAIKKYRVSSLSCKSDIDLFCREVSILCEVDHPNVIKFVGACLDEPSQFAILTHFAEGGSLYALLHEQKRVLDIPIKYGIAIDVARGMTYLHQLPTPIMHRDLNSHNILLDEDGQGLIADFGESTFLKSPDEDNLTKQPGNLRWMAPEIFTQSTQYSIKADMFSFALCLWEIFTGDLPLQDRKPAQAAYDMSYMNVRPIIPLMFSRPLIQLIHTGWALNPEERPSFKQAYGTLSILASNIQTNTHNHPPRPVQSIPYPASTWTKYDDSLSILCMNNGTIARLPNESAYVTDPLSTKRINSSN